MERSIAHEILTTIQESSFLVDTTLSELKGTCKPEPFHACALLLGYTMSDMFDTVIAPIYNEHPDLAPDWYREGTPLKRSEAPHLKLSKEARQALLSAFEAAYEKVQSVAGRLSQIADPLEVALYSEGFHQISVRLCQARATLLRAEPE